MKKTKKAPFNVSVVLVVTLLCSAALVLFFLAQSHDDSSVSVPTRPSLAASDVFDERAYYNEAADAFLKTLPEDKIPLLKLVDDTNHYLFYCEKGDAPSCYVYDLDRQTTTVLFAGENGFYCDTKLLIIGQIESWKHVGRLLFFVARNRAPEANFTNSAVAFYTDVYTRKLSFLDVGASAYFPDDTHMVVNKAVLLYPGFFSMEDIYSVTPVTYRLK